MFADLARYQAALRGRGFRKDDPFYHECSACGERAVEKYVLAGRIGGRDIELCNACGKARSWRNHPMKDQREEDLSFSIEKFLG